MEANNTPTGVTSAQLIITALQSRFRSERDTAVAQLSVYVNAHAGIPDHPGLIDECANLVQNIADSEEKLKVVQSLFVASENNNQ